MPRKRLSLQVESVQKRWLNKEEAMKYLGVSDKYLKKLRDEAMLSFSMYGNMIWYDINSIDKFILRHKEA